MAEGLFSEFSPVSSKQWKQQIQYELKGADYNETLVWESPEGIKVKPFYHSDESEPGIPVSGSQPGFLICQDIFVYDVEKSAYRAKDSLRRGAESIRFTIDNQEADVAKLISGLDLDNKTLFFRLRFLSPEFVKAIDSAMNGLNCKCFILADPIHQLASDGNWFQGGDNFDILSKLATETKNCSVVSADMTIYQNAGANIVQQLAYGLSHVNEYFNRLPKLQAPITIQVAVGSNYFFEIAKLRALRILFGTLAAEYGHQAGCHILAVPSKRNKTLYDYNVNMLRTTTECMSAIIGRADTISNLPYDALYHKSNEFGERISRNQLLILKHESYFDKVANPADGSYYLESLTNQLTEKALELFKEIESSGGLLRLLKEGTIQKKISESAAREQELFDSGKEILLGTNKYPNKNDRMAHDLELFPFVKTKPRKTLITPIIEKRLAEKMEQERLELEKLSV